MTGPIDLHLHSTLSDGTATPREVVGLAAAAGLSAISLTDHDTIRSFDEARRAAATAGIEYLAGTEISLVVRDRSVHLLVYLFDVPSPMSQALERLERSRQARVPRLLERLEALGMPLTEEEVRREAGGELLGRLHFAHALVRKGQVSSVGAAFERFLGRGRPAYLERDRLDAAEAIELAHVSGGVTSVAHPAMIADHLVESIGAVEELASLGLDAVEVWHPSHDSPTRARFHDVARSLALLATGGSDFHGDRKPGIRVGRGRGDIAVSNEVVAQLRARRRTPRDASAGPEA